MLDGMTTAHQRSLAIAAFSIFGATTAFAVGARVGSELDHQTHQVSVARIPVGDLRPSAEAAPAAPSAVAQK
jgi:hypothetical protein